MSTGNPLGLMLPAMPAIQLAGSSELAKPPMMLITGIVDDSGSIRSCDNDDAIRIGHNGQLDSYAGSPHVVLVKTRYLNGHVLSGYCKPEDAVRMDHRNYNPDKGTPLYQQSRMALEEVEAAAAGFMPQYDVFTMSYIMTDGANTGPGSADDVRVVHLPFSLYSVS